MSDDVSVMDCDVPRCAAMDANVRSVNQNAGYGDLLRPSFFKSVQ